MKHHDADVAVIGAGILGLAFAYEASREGNRVVVFERSRRAQGASVRNFGMLWPVGMRPGEQLRQALRSRSRWLDLAQEAGFWHDPCGSLHLAYQQDEWAVLQEFVAQSADNGFDCELLTPGEVLRRSQSARPDGLIGGLFSRTEVCIDSRQAVTSLAEWLRTTREVDVRFNTPVRSVEMPYVTTAAGERWRVRRVVVCAGADFQTLYPQVFAGSGVHACKLQMMRTRPQPGGWRFGPTLVGGLTLLHYPGFQKCRSLAVLRDRITAELPEYVRYGIHVMATQNELGEVVIGDSHEYGADVEPFDKPEIDELILSYFRRMAVLPDWTIAERWHGVYSKHPSLSIFEANPEPEVKIVTVTSGVGMTLSFGIAEDSWHAWASGGLPRPIARAL